MKNEKQQQAQHLYYQTNLSQAQIAKMLEIAPKTLYNWMTEGRWRQQKKAAEHMPSKIVEQQYYMLANLGHEILQRGHQPFPLTHEGEAMRKIAVTIRHLKNRQTVNEAMESFTHLAEIINHHEPDLAERIKPYIQKYIQNRVDVKFADLADESYSISPQMDEMYDYEVRPFDDDETGGITEPNNPSPTTGPGSSGGQSAITESTPPSVTAPSPSEKVGERLLSAAEAFSAKEASTVAAGRNKRSGSALSTKRQHVTSPSPSERVGERPSAPHTTTGQVINTPTPLASWWNPDDACDTLSVNTPSKPVKPKLRRAA